MAEVDDLPALTRALLYAESFELGIIPATPWDDVKRALAQLPPDEARRMRRKFRKAWKKALKDRLSKKVEGVSSKRARGLSKRMRLRLERDAGAGTRMPAGRHVQQRRLLVYHLIMERVDEAVKNNVKDVGGGHDLP